MNIVQDGYNIANMDISKLFQTSFAMSDLGPATGSRHLQDGRIFFVIFLIGLVKVGKIFTGNHGFYW
jgi:hypothetical protein